MFTQVPLIGSTMVIGIRDMPSIYDNIAVIKRQLRAGKKKSAFIRQELSKYNSDYKKQMELIVSMFADYKEIDVSLPKAFNLLKEKFEQKGIHLYLLEDAYRIATRLTVPSSSVITL
jgi:hypothetical protein